MVIAVSLSLWNLVLQSDIAAKNHSLEQVHSVIQCVDDPSCSQFRLTSRVGSIPRGLVLVRGTEATVVVDGIRPNASGSTIYVLWQKPRDTTKLEVPVGAFDVTCRGVCVVEMRDKQPIDLASTQLFKVTLEAKRCCWETPATAEAEGQVSPSS